MRQLDKEACRVICSQYDSKTALLHGDPSRNLPPDPYVHHKCYRNGWLTEFFHDKRHDKSSKYTFEYCHELASHCSNRADFAKLVGCRYTRIYKAGWIDIFANEFNWMNKSASMSKRLRKYTDEDVIAAAKKFTKLCDFRANDRNMYNIARKRKLLTKCTWLQRNDGVKNCFADNIYVYEFPNKVAYIGRTVNPIGRDNDHHKPGSTVYNYAVMHGISIPEVKYLYKGITVEEGKCLEDICIGQYKDSGWHLLNQMKGGGCGNLYRISKTTLMKIAKKYEYAKDFYKHNSSAYNALVKYGWIDECTWLKYIHEKPGKWENYELCENEAKKYHGRDAFRVGSPTAFNTAWKNGWIAQWFPLKLNRGKPVEQYDLLSGRVIEVFESTNDASKRLKLSRAAIQACCHGRNQSCGGYGFRFHNSIDRPSAMEQEDARLMRNAKHRERIKSMRASGWRRVTDPITKKRNWVAPIE